MTRRSAIQLLTAIIVTPGRAIASLLRPPPPGGANVLAAPTPPIKPFGEAEALTAIETAKADLIAGFEKALRDATTN